MFEGKWVTAIGQEVAVERDDLQRLYAAEYSAPIELAFRLSVVAVAGAVYSYTTPPDLSGYIWAGAYVLLHLITFAILATAPNAPSRARVFLGFASYFTLCTVFFSLPLMLLGSGNPLLSYCAGAGLAAMFIYMVWRKDVPAALLPYEVALTFITGAVLGHEFYQMAELPIQKAIVVLLTFTTCLYYSMTLYTTRRDQRRLRAANQRSLQAQKMESLGRMSGGIAHDFNNMLTVVQGNLELYGEIRDPDERQEVVRQAHRSATRASSLVRQLLSFARQAPLQPRELEAGDVIGQIEAMAGRLLPSSLIFEVRPTPKQLRLWADHDGLISALLNLLLNARDAVGQSGKITLWASPALPEQLRDQGVDLGKAPRRYTAFHIRDDGPGLPLGSEVQIFEPFYTTKPPGAGTGLGLASARGFAQQSGGGLVVSSVPGCTTFTLYLPVGLGAR